MVKKDYAGKLIRGFRTIQGLTLKDLSELSGISVTYISQVETGKVSPSYEVVQKLATALKHDLIIQAQGTDSPVKDFKVPEVRPEIDLDDVVEVEDVCKHKYDYDMDSGDRTCSLCGDIIEG